MLETITPREQSGRDIFGRYRAQARSAVIACLSILDGKSVDRVYCDLHDDFVVRLNDRGQYFYLFYQVKTKGKKNHNWTINEIFGLNTKIKDQNKQCDNQIKDSYAGKLLMHTINFSSQCRAVIFQTNIHIDDNIDDLISDIESSNFTNKYTKVLISRFNSSIACDVGQTLSEERIRENLAKLKFETDIQYLKEDVANFEPIAREKIFEYSEVDLQHEEVKEILLKLVDLVERKSSGIITEFTSVSIEDAAGISIEDLLGILCISKDAYDNLIEGGDSKAIKSASIIQRILLSSGANIDLVNYCAKCKTGWDTWVRKNRHVLPELDLHTIVSKVRQLLDSESTGGTINFSSLQKPIVQLIEELGNENLKYDLTVDLILGTIFSELIRDNS